MESEMDESHSIYKSSLYRAVWRWHFIAGLLVLPFLLLLAVTGGLYLFKDEIDHLIYRTLEDISVPSGASLSSSALIGRVETSTGGKVLQVVQPENNAQSIRMIVRMANGEPRTAFVDPYDGRVLGTTRFGGVMQIIRKLHSLQYFGPRASWLVEIAAGWAIVLVGTGIYLWWPRGRSGGVVSVRGTPRQRMFWRDTHAVTGAFAGVVVLFLAVTGMPWSDVWGSKVQELATATETGRPNPPAEVVPDWQLENSVPPQSDPTATHHHHEQVKPALPWALEKAPPPPSGADAGRQPIDVDAAINSLTRERLPRPYAVTLPQGPRGAYVGSYTPARVEDTRIVYIDQYDAHILDDVGYERFGPTAKAIEWGIAVHQGQEFGAVNRYVMLAGCIAIVVLAISSVTMWWKRRPKGSLGLPPAPRDSRVFRGLIAIIIPVGILYPLVGVSFVAALAVDGVVHAIGRARRSAL
jgi:uncharacterized iron-regulated membrane protein